MKPGRFTKRKSQIDYWAENLAPSDEPRQWYQHDSEKWPEFRRRYFAELESLTDALEELRQQLGDDTTTLLFASKETALNSASALKEYLEALGPN